MSSDTKAIVKAGLDKAGKELTSRLEKHGFKRTKKWYWVRLKETTADFIHLHVSGSSYGGPINHSVSFRVHCGNRVLNEELDFLHLNGPNSNSSDVREKRYHLRFNAKSGSTYDRCLDDLERYILESGEPWFSSIISGAKNNEVSNTENIKQSYRLLGIKEAKV